MSFARTASITPIQVLSDQLRLLLRSDESPFQMSAMVVDVPPGGAVPPHTHGKEEGYFVLQGELALTVGEETCILASGDFGHVLPGEVHGYANLSSSPVRFLAWTVGGAIDQFLEAMNRRVKRMPQDAAAMAEITARFGVEMVGVSV